ncbi:DAK2 domain-containing protein [Shumkonia mesophila]|uniref:DAK2 domain-containing protein n=1 Tax=Shumkonia mesophila TaxID=2838854 RepID=UPI00293489F0|nr:DAK2 domain-containing protein [Shumkonia mesophila]
MALTTQSLAAGLARVAARMETAADELNALDGRIGDGDLGVTMVRIGRALNEGAADLPNDVGMALMKCVQAITKVSGSSYATLVATALMSAAKTCKGRTTVPLAEMSGLLAGTVEAMKARGKAELGDKTVIDAVDAAAKAAAGLAEGAAILAAAGDAVDATMARLREQPSRVGRARIWAEKSVGLDDPGMVAFRRMIDGLSG